MTSLLYFIYILIQVSLNSKKLDNFEIYRKSLLKNVQDGISRPLGSQEIQKTKMVSVSVRISISKSINPRRVSVSVKTKTYQFNSIFA